mgnify:CR=1 FL=1
MYNLLIKLGHKEELERWVRDFRNYYSTPYEAVHSPCLCMLHNVVH